MLDDGDGDGGGVRSATGVIIILIFLLVTRGNAESVNEKNRRNIHTINIDVHALLLFYPSYVKVFITNAHFNENSPAVVLLKTHSENKS